MSELLTQALAALEAGELGQAEALSRAALQHAVDDTPDGPAVQANLWRIAGLCARLRRDAPAAEQAWRQALRLAPGTAVCRDLAALLTEQGRDDEALACHQALTQATPDEPVAWVDLAVRLMAAHRRDEAEAACRRALVLRPDDVAAHTNLGLVLEDLRRDAEAGWHQRRAHALAPHNPVVLCHLASLLARTDATARAQAEAEALYQAAIRLDPASSMAHANLGVLHFDHDRLDAAEACFRTALALRPDAPTAHLNLAQLLLARGRFAQGWALWERRYGLDIAGALPAFPRGPVTVARRHGRPVAAARWHGEPLVGKALLVWPEQGHGDQVQFSRYLRRLKALGPRRLTLACSAPLLPLLHGLAGPDEVIALADAPAALAAHDLWAPLLGLPHHCDAEHLDGGFAAPTAVPYLQADPARQAQWSGRLPPRRPLPARQSLPSPPSLQSLRVGLVWRGFAWHDNDAHRSLPGLAPLAPLWSVPGVDFISLQKGAGEDEAAAPPPGQPLTHLGSDIADFADTAALLSQLDLLISVDTAAVHVAGAIGLPCWVLLPARLRLALAARPRRLAVVPQPAAVPPTRARRLGHAGGGAAAGVGCGEPPSEPGLKKRAQRRYRSGGREPLAGGRGTAAANDNAADQQWRERAWHVVK